MTSRPSPSGTPYKSPSPNLGEIGDNASNNAALLQRLRAGSMPQRSNFVQSSGPFGPSVFSTNWAAGRERTSTLASIASLGSNGPSSPAQSSFSRENGDNDMQMRTLDYLGLADTPQQPRATLAANPFLANMIDLSKQANRFRSYSVNAKEQYAEDEDGDYENGSLTPYEAHQSHQAAQLQYQLAQTNAAIQQHNLAVQAFANQASTNRPRARTAGVLESPGSRLLRNYYPQSSRLDNSVSASELGMSEGRDYDGLPEAVQALGLGQSTGRNEGLLSADNNMEGPTSALWLGSIPSSTTVSTLTEMFKSHGQINSARVLTHKNCGFVNYEHVESAIAAKAMMNGKEIFPGAGPVRINFAKPPSASGTPGADGAFPSPSPDPFAKGTTPVNGTPGVISRPGTAPLTIPNLEDMRIDITEIVKQFGANEEDQQKIARTLQQAIQYNRYETEIPTVQEPAQNRQHDAPKLREIRKRIDNSSWSPPEIEAIAMEMLPEVAELSSDYLGNTVVQKLFEFCTDSVRDAMLAEIAPHMAEIGVHKNGTWAAQKIIDVAKQPHQMGLVVDNLRPYTVPLFLDQFGNYVLQCCLRFGSPYNDFIFETMLTKMWEIAQGRYGARAMRACLESHHSTREQQRMLAATIALHSVQLATNANGALLLTWFLDTCTFPQRRTVLAPRLVPHLVHLCTHKVAYLTVLKVINQRNEPEARDTILKALFFTQDDQVLEDILSDHVCGATLIFKVLTTPFFDESMRAQVVENVRRVLLRLKAQPGQGYKRLMDEVGLSTRNGSTGPRDHGHPTERRQTSQPPPQQPQQQQFSQFYPQQYEAGMQRTDSVESIPFPSYVQTPMFQQNVPMTTAVPLQYQQPMRPMNNFYGSNFGFNSPNPADYRQPTNGGSIQQMNYPPPGYGMGFGYGAGMPYMQQEQVNGRRGRVSSHE
jgi:protein JSN1